jgi:hypothetical protein
VSIPTGDLTTAKLLFNSTRFMTLDVSNFYLKTPLDQFEYMRLHLDIIPEEIIKAYRLHAMAHNGWVYMVI